MTPGPKDQQRPGDRTGILRLELCVYPSDRAWKPGNEFIHPGILHVMDRDLEPLIFPSGALSRVARQQRGVGGEGGAAAESTLHILISAILGTELGSGMHRKCRNVLKWTFSDLRWSADRLLKGRNTVAPINVGRREETFRNV